MNDSKSTVTTVWRTIATLLVPFLVAMGFVFLKGPVVYPYDLSWSTAGLVAGWIIWSVLYTALCSRCPLSQTENHAATFLGIFFLLPVFLLLELPTIPWPAEPGTGKITRLVGLCAAYGGSVAGTFSLLALMSGQTARYPWARGVLPFIMTGPFTGSYVITAEASLLAGAAWIIINGTYDGMTQAANKWRGRWLSIPEKNRTRILLAGLYLVSFAVRLPPAAYIVWRSGYIGCGIDYYEAAANWHDGNLVIPLREPGAPIFFYLAMLLGGKSFATIAVAQCLLGATVPLLCYLVARQCFPTWMAWTVALLTAFYGRLIVYSYFLSSEDVQIVTVLLVALGVFRCMRSPGNKWLAVLGVLFALSALAKPSALLLMVPALILIAWRKPFFFWAKAGLIAGGCCAVILLAWMMFDYRVSGKFHAGTRLVNEFILSNHPLQVNGINWDWDKSRNAYDILREDYGFVGDNPEALPNNLFTSGLTTEWQNLPKVVAFRFRHAGDTAVLVMRKLHQLYFRHFICPEKFDFNYLLEGSPFYWFARAKLLLLALFGIFSLRYASNGFLRHRLFLASIPFCYALVYSVFSPSPRNNMPAICFMLMFFVFAVFVLFRVSLSVWGDKSCKALTPNP